MSDQFYKTETKGKNRTGKSWTEVETRLLMSLVGLPIKEIAKFFTKNKRTETAITSKMKSHGLSTRIDPDWELKFKYAILDNEVRQAAKKREGGK